MLCCNLLFATMASRIQLRHNADVATIVGALALKQHRSPRFCKQGVVSTAPDIDAGMKPGAPLPNNDRTGRHRLAAIPFHTQPLGFGIASVTAAKAWCDLQDRECRLEPADQIVRRL